MFSRTHTRAAATALAVIAAMTVGTPAAQASAPATAVTKTTLTPYDSYDSTSRYGATNKRTISGTASGLTATTVDVVCLNPSTGFVDRTLSYGVTVAAGKWATEIWTGDLQSYRCRVAAIESGVSPAGDTDAARLAWGAAFKSLAPIYQIFQRYDYYYVTGGSPLKWINYSSYMDTATPSSYLEMYGPDQYGIYRFQPRKADGSKENGPFGPKWGNGALSYVDKYVSRGGTDTASILVDNTQAFTNYSLGSYDDNYGPVGSTKTSYSVNAKTGVATVTDVMPLFKCTKGVSGTVYNGASYCPDTKTTKLGVSWTQTKTVNAAGNTVKVTNTFTSLDKKAHTVRLIWKDMLINGKFRYGTSGTFGDFNGDERTNVTGYGVKSDPTAATGFTNAIGQVVFGGKATTWASSGWYGTDFYAMMSASVKAGKSASINVAYTLITDDTKAASQISNALK